MAAMADRTGQTWALEFQYPLARENTQNFSKVSLSEKRTFTPVTRKRQFLSLNRLWAA